MNFIHKVPLASSKCLSKWIKVDKWDYFQNGSQMFFFTFIFIYIFIFLNVKPLSEVATGLLVIQIQIQAVWEVIMQICRLCAEQCCTKVTLLKVRTFPKKITLSSICQNKTRNCFSNFFLSTYISDLIKTI